MINESNCLNCAEAVRSRAERKPEEENNRKKKMCRRRDFILDLIERPEELKMSEVMHEELCTLRRFIAEPLEHLRSKDREYMNPIIRDIVDTANKLIATLNLFEEFAIDQHRYDDACEWGSAVGACVQLDPDYEQDTWRFCTKKLLHRLWKYKRFFKMKLSPDRGGLYEPTERLKITDAQIDRLFPC